MGKTGAGSFKGWSRQSVVWLYDQRGHGRSFQPSEGYSPEHYADDLKKMVDELGWKKFVLVGHSMGGRNVLNFAARHPDYISHLVIEDIGPEANPQAHEYYEYLLNLVPTPFATRAEAKKYFFEDFVNTAKTRENIQVMANYFYSNMAEQATNRGLAFFEKGHHRFRPTWKNG